MHGLSGGRRLARERASSDPRKEIPIIKHANPD
jgi:hypothetical protein